MNFLAHIHIASHCNSDITGNLLGDFVKGNPEGKYPKHIVDGILLHRFVDKMTDSHKISKAAKQCFNPLVRRFSPIALDVFWDHCLANDWHRYSDMELHAFCRDAERSEKSRRRTGIVFPERYLRVADLMWERQWLTSYKELDTIELALRRMSVRSPRMAPLADCFADIDSNYQHLRSLFSDLYPEVLSESLKMAAQQK